MNDDFYNVMTVLIKQYRRLRQLEVDFEKETAKQTLGEVLAALEVILQLYAPPLESDVAGDHVEKSPSFWKNLLP